MIFLQNIRFHAIVLTLSFVLLAQSCPNTHFHINLLDGIGLVDFEEKESSKKIEKEIEVFLYIKNKINLLVDDYGASDQVFIDHNRHFSEVYHQILSPPPEFPKYI